MGSTIENGELVIDHLCVADAEVVDVVSRYPQEERDRIVTRLLTVGARGLRSMGLSVSLDDVNGRIKRSYAEAAAEATTGLADTLQEIVAAARQHLDPQRVDSPVGRHLRELEEFRRGLLEGLDPARSDSHPGRLLDLLESTLGSGGELEHRIRALLDPTDAESAVAGLAASLTTQIGELRDAILHDRGRRHEAEVGTRKGFDYEDVLEDLLRELGSGRGWWVERTGAIGGSLADAKVGDFVVHLNDVDRVVVEAKRSSRITLTGADGILSELDRAMANREAQLGICVSAEDAFPKEVGSFAVYGNRILVVDAGDGTMVEVALRWAQVTLQHRSERASGATIDRELVADRLHRLRNLAKRFSGTKRSLTQIGASVDEVRKNLDGIRMDVMDQLSDLESHLLDARDNVVHLSPVESV